MAEIRTRSLYSPLLLLPLVAAMLLVVVASRAYFERAGMVARLTDQIAHGSPEEVTAAVRLMAAMPDPPLAALVGVSASPDGAIAAVAQAAVSDVLASFDRRIKIGQNVNIIASNLAELAQALAARQSSLSASDQAWIARTTHEVLRVANQLPPGSAPGLAATCDSILSKVDTIEMAQTAFAPRRPAPFDSRSTDDRAEPLPVNRASDPSRNTREPPLVDAGRRKIEDSQRTSEGDTSANHDHNSHAFLERWKPFWSGQIPLTVTPLPADSATVRILPPRPSEVSAPADSMVTPNTSSAGRFADVDPRELLELWLITKGVDAITIEQELARRGFRRLSRQMVEALFSEQTQDRLRLVDDVLKDSATGARPWLMLLADDPNADVRLAALTVMATSSDRDLIEKAWQVAIRDRDPRIADLAARLHGRRSGDWR